MNKKLARALGVAIGGFVFYKAYSKLNTKTSEKHENFIQPDENKLNQEDSNNWEHKYLEANGIKFHYVTQGEGPLLILLHGFPENWYAWKKQIPFLAKKYKVVALDMRGYNLSDKPDSVEDYKLPVLVDDIKEIIKSFNTEKAVIIGHDWGGIVSWAFAMNHPEMVEKLVIMNAPHPAGYNKALRSSPQIFNSWYVLFFQLPVVPENLFKKDDYSFMIKSLKQSSSKPEQTFAEDDIQNLISAIKQPKALTSMINYYRALVRFGMTEIKKIEMPTLLIWGENDKFLRKEVNRGIAKYISDLKIKYIPEASHWVNRDCPEKVNHELEKFLF